MFTIHGSQKLRDRVKPDLVDAPLDPDTAMGDWYATALFWKPQVALFVNERTFLPVLVELAPAKSLAGRFPGALEAVLDQMGTDPRFVAAEIAAMTEARWAKTSNRRVVGVMNEFSFLADVDRHHERSPDLVAMAVRLSKIPLGPLKKRTGFPDLELQALVGDHLSRSYGIGPTPAATVSAKISAHSSSSTSPGKVSPARG